VNITSPTPPSPDEPALVPPPAPLEADFEGPSSDEVQKELRRSLEAITNTQGQGEVMFTYVCSFKGSPVHSL
jgi:hypothetical protein